MTCMVVVMGGATTRSGSGLSVNQRVRVTDPAGRPKMTTGRCCEQPASSSKVRDTTRLRVRTVPPSTSPSSPFPTAVPSSSAFSSLSLSSSTATSTAAVAQT